MRVEVWGRTGHDDGSTFRPTVSSRQVPSGTPEAKGKGKEKELDGSEGDTGWKVLESWDVTLNELRPLPEAVSMSWALFHLTHRAKQQPTACPQPCSYSIQYLTYHLVLRRDSVLATSLLAFSFSFPGTFTKWIQF